MNGLRLLRLVALASIPTALVASCSLANKPGDAITGNASSGQGGGASTSVGSGGSTTTSAGGGPANTCPNGKLEQGEQCDDGQETKTCNIDCTKAMCGDGKVNRTAGEQCDDGNSSAMDACNPACQVTPFDIDATASPVYQDAPIAPDVTVVKVGGVDSFVVVWSRFETGGKGRIMRMSRWDAKGARQADDFVLSSQAGFTGPRLATNGSGRTLVAWGALSGGSNELHYRMVDGGDASKTLEQTVTGAAPSFGPQAAAAANGNFCMAWLEGPAGNLALETRCLDPMGGALGGIATIVAAFGSGGNHVFGAIGLFPVGDHFLTSYLDAAPPHYLFGRELGPNGKPLNDTQFPLSTPPAGVTNVFVGNGIGEGNGSYAVVAGVNGLVGPNDTTVMRGFDAQGQPGGPEQPVESNGHRQDFGALARGAGSDYFAVWSESASGSKDCWIRGRRVQFPSVIGDPALDLMPETANRCAVAPRVAVDGAGNVMAVWLTGDQSDMQFPSKVQAAIWPGLMATK